jgi:sterol 3beta-glucosyltransferase/vancomycin aglycone glucosyltransferase
MLRGQDKPLHAALREAGSAAAGQLTMFRARSPRLHLVACSPAIAPPPSDLAATTHFTGAWFDPAPPTPLAAPLEDFLAAGPPPVVITFGSMAASDPAALQAAVVAGVRDAGLRAVLQGGATGRDGDDVMTIGLVDHRALFPRSALVIHHGGAGTTHAAVAAGVPSIVIPHVGDQPYWAARLHELGVAPRPLDIEAATPAEIRDRVLEAAGEPMCTAAESLGRAVAAGDGVGAAVDLLSRSV